MKKIIGLSMLAMLVCFMHLPAHAGEVKIINKCSQNVNWEIMNNDWLGIWTSLGKGYTFRNTTNYITSAKSNRCPTLMKFTYVPWEKFRHNVSSAEKISQAQAITTEHCTKSGCPMWQCGNATYEFTLVIEEYPDKGFDLYKCVLSSETHN